MSTVIVRVGRSRSRSCSHGRRSRSRSCSHGRRSRSRSCSHGRRTRSRSCSRVGGPVQLLPSPPKDHRYGCQPFLNFFGCVRLVILRGILPDKLIPWFYCHFIHTYTLDFDCRNNSIFIALLTIPPCLTDYS